MCTYYLPSVVNAYRIIITYTAYFLSAFAGPASSTLHITQQNSTGIARAIGDFADTLLSLGLANLQYYWNNIEV